MVAALPGRLRAQSIVGTGLLDLDWLLGGLAPGKLTLLSGRRGSGKTSLLLSIARHATLCEKRYVAALLIGHRLEKIQRMMTSSEAGVPLHLLGSKAYAHEVREAEDRLSRSTLHACSQPHIKLQDLAAFTHRIAGKLSCSLLLIDDIHQIIGNEGETWSASEEWRAALVRGLRNLARESGVSIVAVCDSAPGTECRRDQRLQLSDLDGPSSLEDHADAVLLLQAGRPASLNRHEAVTLSVAKNRNGATGDVEVLFDKQSFLFLPESAGRLPRDWAGAWLRSRGA